MKDWDKFIRETTNPKVIAGIVACVDEEERFLIVKRSKTDRLHPGYWEWPGGHIDETDESIEEGAARELLEEANVQTKVSDLIYFAVQRFTRPAIEDPNKELHVTRYFFITKNWTGDPKIVPNPETGILEHDDLKWATKEEILSLDNSEIDNYLLDKAVKAIGGTTQFDLEHQLQSLLNILRNRNDREFNKLLDSTNHLTTCGYTGFYWE